jgi:hypothetical protein
MSLPTFIERSEFDFTNVQKMDYKEILYHSAHFNVNTCGIQRPDC